MQRAVARIQRNEFSSTEIPRSSPFVKWAGGKTQLLGEYTKYLPQNFDRYFEPFLGGGAMFFCLISRNTHLVPHLSDINSELISTYKVVKHNVEELIEVLRRHERNYNKGRNDYYYYLRRVLKPHNNIERAARFIALNKTCYNGLYRVNKSGKFNVPMGNYKNPLICDAANLRKVSLALRHTRAVIENTDYADALRSARKGDFVYIDPPYAPASRTASFTSYTHDGFDDEDQKKLAQAFRTLNYRGCKLMLSNSDTPLVRALYHEFLEYTINVNALRAINCKGSRRRGHQELLIRNYK